MDWQRYWEEYPRRFGETEFREQVGRIAGGVPTPEEEVELVLEETRQRLRLGSDDRLLDLCCGNGYLTRRLAESASEVVGVDFSATMLELARRHHDAPNVRYLEGSVTDLGAALGDEAPFDKVCMLESLHYFTPDDIGPMLAGIVAHATPDALLYFSGVTDAERWDRFFDTPERRREHARRKAEGTDVMGHWWARSEIEGPAAELGLECEFLPQNPALVTAHYRFDVVLTRG